MLLRTRVDPHTHCPSEADSDSSKVQALTLMPAAVRWSCKEPARLLYASLLSM